ncbi:MAG: aminoacyl-tRNA hydrolase [Candidatus Omnitrophota bacterium]
MKSIIGLGNPGFRYRNTRHNVGFEVVSFLAKKYRINLKNRGFSGIYGIGKIQGEETMLFKPRTYMNLSGEAVGSVYSSKLEGTHDLLVISDDFNLPLGAIRLREKGSAGGHNGLKSIIERIGEDFPRLRVGVAAGEVPEGKTSYVLGSFSRKEKDPLKEMIEKAAECTETWLTAGIKEAMARFNGANNAF